MFKKHKRIVIPVIVMVSLLALSGIAYGIDYLIIVKEQRDEQIAVVTGLVEEIFRGEFKDDDILKLEYYVDNTRHNDKKWYENWLNRREDGDWALSINSISLPGELYDAQFRENYPAQAFCDFDCCTHPYGYDCDDRQGLSVECYTEKNENGRRTRNYYMIGLVTHKTDDPETVECKLGSITAKRTEVLDSDGNVIYTFVRTRG